ncbi:MAG TPA: hypothetical protein VJT71_11625, partial [Pyrinomonadaceae bacterium]|nr:hypothetical protein [Pyrinomonadaceae bacterium]
LRRLASGHMLFELTPSRAREWDRFEARNIGLALQRRIAREFGGDAERMRASSVEFLRRTLGIGRQHENEGKEKSSGDLALVLAMIPDINRWNAAEKALAARVLSAKNGADEATYLKQMQKHASLRASLIRFGSKSS